MMVGKVVGLGFEIISKLDSLFLMTVSVEVKSNFKHTFHFIVSMFFIQILDNR